MVSIVIPHPMLQHQPTRQRTTVHNWLTPTTRLTRKATKRLSQLSEEEKRVCARSLQQQSTKVPLNMVPGIII
jgi:hypothetical protein